MKTRLIAFAIVIAAIAVVASSALFTVHQTQQALVLQFGNPIDVKNEPGLHFKLPFVQNVEYFERRILDLDPPPQEAPLADQKRVNVDSFVRYKIVDPLEFRKKAGTDSNFRGIFGAQLNSAVRAEVGQVFLADMLSEKRQEVMERITATLKSKAPEFGVEVVDVRIGRTDLPEATSAAVYNRMRSDRKAYAAEIRAEGERQKLNIEADADRQRTIIIAEAKQQSEILRGQGDAERTTILSNAYGRDLEFFDLYRTLGAYEEGLGEGTTMVLSPDSEFFRYFQSSTGR
ncbi:protease modulator HflC [Magnetospira sp. QH-2]|uniref:protease modulator HflC n=1 Tax=Magnetospira sp. (strain QH-2) TaxID=1288970 RepID=UPI0003E80B5E|nr:protease modulator HflC [Magnetospira sp. QH-2]CCQ73483.1 Protease activity modulator HflK [Magnetospira sp. QH-2]